MTGQNTSSAVMAQRQEARDSLDFFPTPPWATRALCARLERRVAAAIDLGNLREMRLPPAISEVVIIADNDPKPEQQEALERAIRVFAEDGRHVRVWRNEYGGKDLNDALMAAMEAERERQKEKAS